MDDAISKKAVSKRQPRGSARLSQFVSTVITLQLVGELLLVQKVDHQLNDRDRILQVRIVADPVAEYVQSRIRNILAIVVDELLPLIDPVGRSVDELQRYARALQRAHPSLLVGPAFVHVVEQVSEHAEAVVEAGDMPEIVQLGIRWLAFAEQLVQHVLVGVEVVEATQNGADDWVGEKLEREEKWLVERNSRLVR